jgi:MFS family permease
VGKVNTRSYFITYLCLHIILVLLLIIIIIGLILSSFFYGYLFTQIVGAWLAIRFGPKIVLVISIFISSIFTLLTPLAARLGYIALFICRFLIGLAHGVVWPSLGGLWPYWVKLLLTYNS